LTARHVQGLAKAAVDGMARRDRRAVVVIVFVFSMESTSFGVSGSDGLLMVLLTSFGRRRRP
jgi:hypothetical protein